MDLVDLIITSLDVKGAFPNTSLRPLKAIYKQMGLPFAGFLQTYLATRLYAIRTVWQEPTNGHGEVGIPKRGLGQRWDEANGNTESQGDQK